MCPLTCWLCCIHLDVHSRWTVLYVGMASLIVSIKYEDGVGKMMKRYEKHIIFDRFHG